MARKLSEQELMDLESVIEEGMRYLVLKTAEGTERMYRMQFPSHEQRRQARLAQHKYR